MNIKMKMKIGKIFSKKKFRQKYVCQKKYLQKKKFLGTKCGNFDRLAALFFSQPFQVRLYFFFFLPP